MAFHVLKLPPDSLRGAYHGDYESRQTARCISRVNMLAEGARRHSPAMHPLTPTLETSRRFRLLKRAAARSGFILPRLPFLEAPVRAKASALSLNRLDVGDVDSSLRRSAANLRLVLGVGRSGTTWVGHVLSSTLQPIRYCSEPLFYLQPRLSFHRKGDHTAVGYEEFDEDHPLLSAYLRLLDREDNGVQKDTLQRDDAGWDLCLVKEVHALLGSEGLLRHYQPPTLFILRDPLYVADSLFSAQTLGTAYLDHEVKAVQKPSFWERFLPGRQEALERIFWVVRHSGRRQQMMLNKVICIRLLQEMFVILTNEFPCAQTIHYEGLCAAPREGLNTAARALSLSWDQNMELCLSKTSQADSTSANPYSVMRNTAKQANRPFRFLKANDVALCRAMLDAIQG
jgi:hypothetical protein